MPTLIDHLVIAAPSLAAGEKMLHETLGVWPQRGGEHRKMGTHNSLLRLGENLYLEVIAIDPSIPDPQRPRWFSLDKLGFEATPRLSTWVMRCDDIHAARTACGDIHGDIESMNRGELNWEITIPADGKMPFDGVAPTLIQWQSPRHPASMLEDRGFALHALKCFHPDVTGLAALMHNLGLDPRVTIEFATEPSLQAEIQTPNGIRVLG